MTLITLPAYKSTTPPIETPVVSPDPNIYNRDALLTGNPLATTPYLAAPAARIIDVTGQCTTTLSGDVGQTIIDTPYTDGGGCQVFDGTGDFVTVTGHGGTNLIGVDWTLDGWFKCAAYPSSGGPAAGIVESIQGWDSWLPYILLSITTTGKYRLCAGGPSSVYNFDSTESVPLNTWTHFAFVRYNGVIKFYINGVAISGYAPVVDMPNLALNFYLGKTDDTYGGIKYFNGKTAGIKLVKGIATYTSNFTPSTLVPTVTPGTAFLFNYVKTYSNETFVDSSYRGRHSTITGDVAQGTFSPFYNEWSVDFHGGTTGASYTIATNSSLNFGTSTDFAIEFWYKQRTTPGSSVIPNVLANNDTEGYIISGFIQLITNSTANGNKFALKAYDFDSAGITAVLQGTTTLTNGRWYHCAVTRTGSTFRLFVNGVKEAERATALNVNLSTFLAIGKYIGLREVDGQVSNLRIVSGNALYTADFTVPTAKLTAINGTVLLICQDNRHIDRSTNNFTITVSGTVPPLVQNISPFKNTLYSLANNQGSLYLSGASTGLTLSGTDNVNLYNSDFTLEGWLKTAGLPGANGCGIVQSVQGWGDWVPFLSIGLNGSGKYVCCLGTLAVTAYATTDSAVLNTWTHFSIVGYKGTIKLYINGTATNVVVTTNMPNLALTFYVGKQDNTFGNIAYYNGKVAGVRLVKGQALHTSNFTPSTLVPTLIDGSAYLLNYDTTVKDAADNFTTTVTGGVTLDTDTPFTNGGGSWAFNGSTGFVALTAKSISLGTSDFTIRFWLNTPNSYASANNWAGVLDGRLLGDSAGALAIILSRATATANAIAVWFGVAEQFYANYVPGAWNHVALCRSGNNLYFYINGVQTNTIAFNQNVTKPLYLVGTTVDNYRLQGYLADFNVELSALYSGNFTPPTAPVSVTPNTALLLKGINAGIYDSQGVANISTSGNPTVIEGIGRTGTGAISISSAYARLFSNQHYDCKNADFTLEFWCKNTGNVHNAPTLVSSAVPSWGAGGVAIQHNRVAAPVIPNTFCVWIYDYNTGSSPFLTTSASYPINVWYHFALCRSGNTFRIFVNGKFEVSGTFTGNINFSTYGLYLGYDAWGEVYSGLIEGFRLYPGVCKYTTELQVVPVGLPKHSSVTATRKYLCLQDTASVALAQSGSLLMDSSAPGGGTKGTLECWLYLPALPANDSTLYVEYDSGPTHVQKAIVVTTAGKLRYDADGTARALANNALTLNKWNHIVVTWTNNNTVTFYVNGVVDSIISVAYTTTSSSIAYSGFGRYASDNWTLYGVRSGIAYVRMYSDVISAATVLSHYNNGTPIPVSGAETNLVAAYNFDGYTSGNVQDMSGNGRHLTFFNGNATIMNMQDDD